jgi:hypothetical protein
MPSAHGRTLADEVSSAGVICVEPPAGGQDPHMGLGIVEE